MTWSGDYSKCSQCGEVYPYAIDTCPCCRGSCWKDAETEERNTIIAGNKRLVLLGEQKAVLTLPPKGAVLIKGGAGSGKTLVSVKRAEYLTQNYSDLFQRSKVAIFAYNKELVKEIQNLISDSSILVQNIDAWVYFFLRGRGVRMGMIRDEDLREARAVAKVAAFRDSQTRAIANKSDDFYDAEIRWLKGRRISSLEEYKNTKRTGRGTEDRVTVNDRELLWKMFEAYNAQLRTKGIRDWEDRVLDALRLVEQPGFQPPYTHIVIDEAQDFSFAKIALIRRLVSPQTESITIVADSAQQIYQSGFSWSDLGIRVVGRSVEFKKNYRNTRQISEAAYSLMSHESDNADFTRMENAQLEGARPLVVTGNDRWSESVLVKTIRSLPRSEDVVVAVPTHRLFPQMEALLRSAGIPVMKSASEAKVPGGVRLSTFHSLKGLQFDHVFLFAVSERYFPTSGVEPDEISKARKLLYVAMTRATRTLTIFTTPHYSRFIDEIDQNLIERMVYS